ncbi:M15 family metallopeptidase [Winogradskyella sp.]|uniref:M15 family metallopeptidase n=1 Tax=Winogradskyella sp. TaxID=1883156 RepID=UPI003F6BABB7
MKYLITVFSILFLLFYFNTEIEIYEIDTPSKGEARKIVTPYDTLIKSFILGKFNYRNNPTFIKVEPKYTSKEIYLKKEVSDAFIMMSEVAKIDGVSLKIISGTRNFYEQKAIWERKWKKYNTLNKSNRAKKILVYSSMPSTSRHHWGTDIDLNSLNNSYFNTVKGKATYNWLKTHANRFGFYQVYTNKTNGRTGYNEEKWHWSYLPLASKYLSYYNDNVKASDISGFKGSEIAEQLKIIEDYVNGISEKAKRYN